MIAIKKGRFIPAELKHRGGAQTRQDKDAWRRERAAYRCGERLGEFDGRVYNHWAVKALLVQQQHEKCCYCEARFYRRTSYGVVEHYRPKAMVRQGVGHPEQRPGYFWLAYSWRNLLFACEVCNTNKGVFFALEDPTARATCPSHSLRRERPLLINPAEQDPRAHLRFRRAAPEALTPTGQETIRCLGLDQDGLMKERQTLLAELAYQLRVLKVTASAEATDPEAAWLAQGARRRLRESVLPAAPYSATARDYLGAIGYLV